MQMYRFEQATPATTWSITHNLASKVVFDVWADNINGERQKIFPKSVVHIDDNSLQLVFNVARSGAVTVVGMGTNPGDVPA